MSAWVSIDRVVRDWDAPEVEPWERKLLSQSEAEARFLRKREREQEAGAGGEAGAASKRIQEGVGVLGASPSPSISRLNGVSLPAENDILGVLPLFRRSPPALRPRRSCSSRQARLP
jgi:hypothetical protein